MSDKTVSVGLRVEGDSRGAVASIDTTEKALEKLDKAGKITLLEGAEQNARDLAVEIERTRQRVQALETTLSEAYSAGADDQQIMKISRQLDAARREADSFSLAAEKNSVSLNRLRLAAREAGIDIANLSGERLRLERLAQSTASLQRSFDSLRIRTAQQIEADLQEVNQALLKLAQRADLSGDEFDRAFAAGQKRIATLKAELQGVPDEMGRVGQKVNVLSGMLAQLGGAFAGIELARQFVMVNAELENVARSFTAVTGSAAKATAEMDYARDVANRLGLEQISTAKAYASLMAATKGTSVEGEVSRQVFESVARSMSLAGKSVADTEGALQALQQMASKGVISMEELRGQLGERLPGALGAAAAGLGITTDQLIKLTESGRLTAEELFPALAKGLNDLYKDGGAETLTQEWNHFKNAVQDAYQTIGDAGVVNGLKVALEGMETVITTTSTMIVALGQNIGTFMAALANGDIGINGFSETAKRAFAEIEAEAQAKLVATAQHNSVMAASLTDAGKAALAAAQQHKEATSSTASDWTRVNVAFEMVKESGAAATKQAEKNAEATKAEGAAAVELANALGGEADQRNAKIEATRNDATALAAVAERRREELAMVTEHIAALEREAEAQGGATAQQQKVIDALKVTAEARQADADKANAQAAAAQTGAVQAKVEAAGFDQVTGALGRLSAARRADTDLAAVNIRLAIEQQKTIVEVARAKGDEDRATRALLEIKRLEIQLAELTAQAKKMEAEATLLKVQATRAELEASGQLTPAKAAELNAQEAAARVKQVEAQIASELATRMRELAGATRLSGTAARDASGAIGGVGSAAQGSVPGVDALTASYLRLNNAMGGGSPPVQGSDGVWRNGAGEHTTDKGEVLKDKNGKAMTNTTSILDDPAVSKRSAPIDVVNALYLQGASVDEARAAQKYFGELHAREVAADTGKRHTDLSWARQLNNQIDNAVTQALALARKELATGQAVNLGASVAELSQRNRALLDNSHGLNGLAFYNLQNADRAAGIEAKEQTQRAMNTVNININGQRTQITASPRDTRALTDLLRTLETDASRAL